VAKHCRAAQGGCMKTKLSCNCRKFHQTMLQGKPKPLGPPHPVWEEKAKDGRLISLNGSSSLTFLFDLLSVLTRRVFIRNQEESMLRGMPGAGSKVSPLLNLVLPPLLPTTTQNPPSRSLQLWTCCWVELPQQSRN
jgi:hypothetical protein